MQNRAKLPEWVALLHTGCLLPPVVLVFLYFPTWEQGQEDKEEEGKCEKGCTPAQYWVQEFPCISVHLDWSDRFLPGENFCTQGAHRVWGYPFLARVLRVFTAHRGEWGLEAAWCFAWQTFITESSVHLVLQGARPGCWVQRQELTSRAQQRSCV
jgi:hypothetical protein